MLTTRRELLVAGALVGLPGCAAAPRTTSDPGKDPVRLTARPDLAAVLTLEPGTTPLPLQTGREGLLHVPPGSLRSLVLVLHGAGGTAEHGLSLLRGQADARGLVLLAPASAGSTWDAITGSGSHDTAAVDAALQHVLARMPLAADRLAVAGFSDGASYALTLGLGNGDVISRIVAFSPGFSAARRHVGRPEVFVTHGVDDRVLPIARTSRRVVPALERQGYSVDYREFPGGHVVPPDLAEQAADWLAR